MSITPIRAQVQALSVRDVVAGPEPRECDMAVLVEYRSAKCSLELLTDPAGEHAA